MNRSETAAVIAYLNRAGLVGAMEGQTVVWAEALADLDVADVQPAVRKIVRTRTSAERWVTPGDVRKAAVKARRQEQARARLEADAHQFRVVDRS